MLLVKEEPLYLKLKNNLKELIESQNLTVLPGTKALEKSYGVSRITARRAIAELAKEGIVCSTQGRKVMVTKHMYKDTKELGFIISQRSAWSENIFSYFAHEALDRKCNLNMFIAGAANNINSNSLFTYLLDSNKFNGLLMLSKQSKKNIELISNRKVQLLTYNFKYKNYDIPAAIFSFKEAIAQMLDFYQAQGLERFAFISFLEDEDDIASGMSRVLVEDYKEEVKKRGLIDYDLATPLKSKTEWTKMTIEALKRFSALPSGQRPQVLASNSYHVANAITSFLAECSDWSPIHILCSGDPSHAPRFIYPQEKLADYVFEKFVTAINNSETLQGNISVPVEFDPGKNK